MKKNKISVIIIFHGRHKHLVNVLKGLESGKSKPEEVVLVEIELKKMVLPKSTLNISHVLIQAYNSSDLPIAKARNLGASIASHNTLVFLDVDCIPSYNFISDIKNYKVDASALYMCKPLYLLESVDDVHTFNFTKDAVEHPDRPKYNGTIKTQDYGLFWSLCFFLSSSMFSKIGKFDENYKGYGAEDTDLSFRCRDLKIPFYLTEQKVYHQQHSFYRPPLNSIESIVRNSNYFFSKWNSWPMANHLSKFFKMNFIEWTENSDKEIQIIDLPKRTQIEKLRITNERYA